MFEGPQISSRHMIGGFERAPLQSSRRSWNEVLKGHDFSRAIQAQENTAALAAEGWF
jgi:hypothetical protein